MDYSMEELLPIVAKLADKYSSKESTSVSYEMAEQLMEGVLYCVSQCGTNGQLAGPKKLTAQEAYQYGYESLLGQVNAAREAYNEMTVGFCAYGNENYQDTVEKAIPAFFRYYDPRFAPQETIITMDYPTICPIVDRYGINAISIYVEFISFEQKFMGTLPQEYIQAILFQFQQDYHKQFYNICSIVLRHVLCHMVLGKRLGEVCTEEDYERLGEMILHGDAEWLKGTLSELLHTLILQKYGSDIQMESYLGGDVENFVVELSNAAKNYSLRRTVVL